MSGIQSPTLGKVKTEFAVSDIEIGAVEIKDSATDIRATVGANGLEVEVKASTLPTGASTSVKQDTQIGQINDVTTTNSHTSNKELRTFQENHICTDNSTSTPLGAGGTFTGGWQDCLQYQEINVSIVADKNSASNGLVFQWSADGTNVGDTDTFSYYTANGGTNYTPNPAFRYFRIVYTNGSEAQNSFNLLTILRRGATGGSFHRIDSTLKDDADARLNITIPKLKTAANTYISQTATMSGNAKVSLEEVETGVVVPISATALPLPTGASTSTLQSTANGYLLGIGGLLTVGYDYISQVQNLTTDVWTFKSGGSGGATVATITITYTDSTKAVISNVAKT